jgi:chromosome segregation ATPase
MENTMYKEAFEASTNDLAVCTAELVKLKEKTVELMQLVARRDRQIFEKDAFIHVYRTQLKDFNLQLNDFANEDALKSRKIEALEIEKEDLKGEINDLKYESDRLRSDLHSLESENDDLANERDDLERELLTFRN